MLFNFLIKVAPIAGAILFSTLAFTQDANISLKANDREWLRLLHAYPTLLSGVQSEATTRDFFLSYPDKFYPENELKALISKINIDTSSPDDHPVCRFPARINWLKRNFPEINIPLKKCTKFENFKKQTSGKSASVVFSSYYLNNPSSSFGHTFLRIGKELDTVDNGNKSLELLDTGINYGAVTGNSGPFLYFFGGLSGYFSGSFTAIPYYYKVREYNDYETRDLWTYQLNLSPDELEQMVNHIWELGHTTFDYYFLSKNCSYHVITILEVVRPDLKLLDELPSTNIIPVETLRVLEKYKLIKRITYRPSARAQFEKTANGLDSDQNKIVKELVEGKNIDLYNYNETQKAKIYDSALSLIDYKYAKDIIKKDELAQSLKRPILMKRALLEVSSPDLDYNRTEKDAPHTSHGAKRLLAGFGKDKKNSLENKYFLDLDWRFSSQDLFDNDDNLPEFTKLEIGRIALRYNESDKIRLKELTLLDIYSLGTWNDYIFSPAWNLRAGSWWTQKNSHKYQTAGIQGGYGVGKSLLNSQLFLVPHIEASYIYEKLKMMKFSYGFDLGVVIPVWKNVKFGSIWQWREETKKWDENILKTEIRWANRQYGLGMNFDKNFSDNSQEYSLKLLQYF